MDDLILKLGEGCEILRDLGTRDSNFRKRTYRGERTAISSAAAGVVSNRIKNGTPGTEKATTVPTKRGIHYRLASKRQKTTYENKGWIYHRIDCGHISDEAGGRLGWRVGKKRVGCLIQLKGGKKMVGPSQST